MPLMQLQILMIVLGLVLLGVIVAMAVPRLRLPAFALPNLRFALPALSLPGMMRPKRSGEAPDQSEPLDPVRLARLQKTAAGDAPATTQEEDQHETPPPPRSSRSMAARPGWKRCSTPSNAANWRCPITARRSTRRWQQ